MCPHNHHHVRVAGEGRCVTPVPWRRRMADLHNVEGMLRCRYEPDRPICCLVDQDDASSPDQAGDQVIGRCGHGEPGGLGHPRSVWQKYCSPQTQYRLYRGQVFISNVKLSATRLLSDIVSHSTTQQVC